MSVATYTDGFDPVARLYDATDSAGSEANFLEVIRGCGEDEVMYRDDYKQTVLMVMAVDQNWPKATTAAIERGCGVNAVDAHGITALHAAGRYNRRETVRVLLEHGADRTIKNMYGRTAASSARVHRNTDLAAYIEAYG